MQMHGRGAMPGRVLQDRVKPMQRMRVRMRKHTKDPERKDSKTMPEMLCMSDLITDPWEVLGFNGEVSMKEAKKKFRELQKTDKSMRLRKAMFMIRCLLSKKI